MSQYINVDLNNGSFLVPCYQYNADSLQSGLVYNTTNLNIQLALVNGDFYNYSSPNILNGTTPSSTGEIGFYQLNPSSYIAKIQLSSDIYSNLILSSGQNIGMVAISASGFAPVVSTLVFSPINANVTRINYTEVSGVGTVSVNQEDVRLAVGLSSANLDTQLADIPTTSEFNARTIPSGDYLTSSDVISVSGGSTTTETYYSSVNTFSMFYSDGSSSFDYYGRNLSGEWQIQKVNRTNSATTTATVANNFLYKTLAKAWENKLTLSYS